MFLAEERNITNALLLNDLDLWDDFTIKTSDDKHAKKYYKKLMAHINEQIGASIDWLDSEEARQLFYEEAEYQYELFQSLEDEWDSILSRDYGSVDDLLEEVYRRGKEKGYADMKERIRYTETDKLALDFAINYNFHLIRKIDYDVRRQIKNTLISGVIGGDNPNRLIPKLLEVSDEKIDDSIFTPKQRATMIAKTEVSRIQNTGMLQSYVNEGYTEVKILTAEDDDVCTTCLEYAYEFNEESEIIFANRGEEKVHNIIKLVKGGMFPPFHPLCRCTYLSIWKTKGEPPENPYIIDLTPAAHANNVPNTIQISDIPVINISSSKLCKELKEIVKDPKELKIIFKLLDDEFRNNVKDNSIEWGAGIGVDGEYQNTYRGIRRKVYLTQTLLDAAVNKGILVFVHSHPVTTSPLASWEDYTLFAKQKVKFGVVTNEFGTIIIKNKDVEKSFAEAIDIEEISSEIQRELTRDFQDRIEYLDENENQEWLSDEEYDKEFQDFAKEHHYTYLRKYQDELNEYMDITFINA